MFEKYKSNVLRPSQYHSLVGLYPIWVGHLTALSNYECKPRVLDDFFIIFVVAGKGKFRCCGKEYQLDKMDIFFLFPGVVHSYATDPNDLLELKWIGYNGPNAKEFLDILAINPENAVIKGVHNVTIHEIIDEIVDDFNMDDLIEVQAGTVIKASGNLYRFFGLLFNLYVSSYPSNITVPAKNTKVIEKALAFIDANFPHDITIAQIASHIGLSRTHFASRFKLEVGYSPSEYLTRIRLKQAKHYLVNSKLSINEVAHSVGFNDPQYFSRFFTKHEGISPSKFRGKSSGTQLIIKNYSKTSV